MPFRRKGQKTTTFYTPTQNYRFLVIPLVSKQSQDSASYTRLLKKVLENADHLENFIDNVIVHSDGFEKQPKTLKRFISKSKTGLLSVPLL